MKLKQLLEERGIKDWSEIKRMETTLTSKDPSREYATTKGSKMGNIIPGKKDSVEIEVGPDTEIVAHSHPGGSNPLPSPADLQNNYVSNSLSIVSTKIENKPISIILDPPVDKPKEERERKVKSIKNIDDFIRAGGQVHLFSGGHYKMNAEKDIVDYINKNYGE